MNKLYLISSLVLIITSCVNKQQNSLKDWNLNGKVESVENQDYKAVFEKGEINQGDKRYASLSSVNFDINGFQTKGIQFNNSGAMSRNTVFKLKDNHIAEIAIFDSYNKLLGTEVNEYENGNLISGTFTDADGKKQATTYYKYNSENLPIKIETQNSANIKTGSTTLTYQEKNVNEYINYDSLGVLIQKVLFKYDSHNNRTDIKSYRNGLISFEEISTYEYDNNDNWVKRRTLNEKDKTGVITVRQINYYRNTSDKLKTTDLLGMWKENEGQGWIEFKDGNKYDRGSGPDLQDSGSFELNNDGALLTLNSTDPGKSKKIYLEYSGSQLIFKSVGGTVEETYVRK